MDYSSTTTRSHAVSGLNSSTTPLAIYSSNVTTLQLLNTTTTTFEYDLMTVVVHYLFLGNKEVGPTWL